MKMWSVPAAFVWTWSAGTPFTSKSAASTPCTRSLKVTRIELKVDTETFAEGTLDAIVGATVLVGGMVTVTFTTAEVPRRPVTSDATAMSALVPNGAFHKAANGAAVSALMSRPPA